MWSCEKDCYRHYYLMVPNITARHAVWIVNGYDPRIDNPSYSNRNIDSNLRMVKRFFGLNSADSIINTKEFFEWAIHKWPDFKQALPVDLIVSSAQLTGELPLFSGYSFSLPEDPIALRKMAIKLKVECQRLTSQVEELKQQNSMLQIDADSYKKYRKKNSDNAKRPRERY